MISKTDFLLYLEAPLHLWAEKHDRLEQTAPSQYVQHLMKQGQEVEQLAIRYLQERFKTQGKENQLERQRKFVMAHFRPSSMYWLMIQFQTSMRFMKLKARRVSARHTSMTSPSRAWYASRTCP